MSQSTGYQLGQQPATDPVVVEPAHVAAWLRARTQDDQGREVGLFTEATRPTVSQVAIAIQQARVQVAMQVGWTTPNTCLAGYQSTVALAAACIVEQSYFPEQIESGRSAYAQLADLLTRMVASLRECIANGGTGPADPGAGVYDIHTPRCEFTAPFQPANWNDPYADDIDDPTQTGDGAVDWLEAHQPVWAGLPLTHAGLSPTSPSPDWPAPVPPTEPEDTP